MIHVTHCHLRMKLTRHFLPVSTVVASLRVWWYLRAVAVEYFCGVSHPESWFVAREDGGRSKNLLEVWARSICVCSTLVSWCVWDRTMGPASVSLLTADD